MKSLNESVPDEEIGKRMEKALGKTCETIETEGWSCNYRKSCLKVLPGVKSPIKWY